MSAENNPNNVVGCGDVGGSYPACVAERGPAIAKQGIKTYYDVGDGQHGVHTSVHEIGHNFGITHNAGERYLRDVDGDGFNEEVPTPFAPAEGEVNNCGYDTASSDMEVKLKARYDTCALGEDNY